MKTFCSTLLLSLFAPLALHAQGTGQITGLVRAESGEPVPGAQVTVVGTQLRAITAANGRYTIADVPRGAQRVRVSVLGYATMEVPVTVDGPSVLDIQIVSEAIALREVVVVGYGTQRRETVTGAVASVTAADFVKGPARDAASLIAGKLPGLAVTQPSGNPTSGAQIQLRGRTTIQGPTNPLILIDGVPGGLQTVAPEDIEAISVLKDGSASAIYGTRASNGVILITTKRHAGGAPTLRYDGYIGQSTIYNSPQFLTAADYRQQIAAGTRPATGDAGDFGFNTDWLNAVLREPASYRHSFSLSGGALNTNYTASLNLENEQGIFNRSDNKELTARASIRHQMFNGKLEAEGNFLSRTQNYFSGPDFNYAWRQALIRNPTDRVQNDAGVWQERTGYFYVNPVVLIDEQNGQVENRNTRLHGMLTFRPTDNWRISLLGGTEKSSGLSGTATTFLHSSNTQGNSGGTASRGTSSGEDRIAELTSTFTNSFGDHSVTLLGGYSYQDFVDESFNAGNSKFPTDLFGWDQLQRGSALGEGTASISSNKSGSKLIGFFSRLNYDWKGKYLLMGSVRYEGNSKFGADHKWGCSPRYPRAGA
jgi:TonB-linked SusC/RagA family outer membrane protein